MTHHPQLLWWHGLAQPKSRNTGIRGQLENKDPESAVPVLPGVHSQG